MKWPWRRSGPTARTFSISDPALAEWLNIGTPNYSGVTVTEESALAVSAFWRGIHIIATSIAGLPLKTMRETTDGKRERVGSIFDNPWPDVLTPFEWRELQVIHLLLHGDAFLRHVRNGAGGLAALVPVHPGAVRSEWKDVPGGKLHTVTRDDGSQQELDSTGITQIMGPSVDGLRGMSVLAKARNSLGTAIAGDRAAAKLFSDGPLMAALISSDEDSMSDDDVKAIRADLNQKAVGWENANKIAIINRRLKLSTFSMSMEDAQFLQSRQFQIEEIARWLGIPPHLLGQTEKQTSWGTGVAEQNRGLARYTLAGWTSRMEARYSTLLPPARFVEFDYAGFLQPTPEVELDMIMREYEAGLITLNEARKLRNLDPVAGGDTFKGQAAIPSEVPA